MEEPIISGVTHDLTEAKVTITNVPDRPGVAASIVRALADAGVNIDMIVQSTSVDAKTDMSFTMPKTEVAASQSVLDDVAREFEGGTISQESDIAKVSLVGAGMKSSPGIAATMFETLANEGINIQMISTSTIRISVIVDAAQCDQAVQRLHTAFGLDAADVYSAPLPERK